MNIFVHVHSQYIDIVQSNTQHSHTLHILLYTHIHIYIYTYIYVHIQVHVLLLFYVRSVRKKQMQFGINFRSQARLRRHAVRLAPRAIS